MFEIIENFANSQTGFTVAFVIFALGIISHIFSINKPNLKKVLFPITIGLMVLATLVFATKLVGLKLGTLAVLSQIFVIFFGSKQALQKHNHSKTENESS